MQNDLASAATARRRRLLRLTIIAALSLAIHAFWFATYSPLAPDSSSYLVPAHALVEHHAFLEPRIESTLPTYDDTAPLVPATFRTPGYPLFLAAFLEVGASLRVVSAVQHLLIIALTLGLFFAVSRATGSETIGFLSATALALYQPIAQFTNGILSEALFLILLCAVMATLYVAARATNPWGWCIAAGLLDGAAVLVRPVAMYYIVAAAVFLLLVRRRSRIAATVVFTIAALLLPGAWILRNAREAGVATLTSLPPENLLFFNAAAATVADERGVWQTLTLPHHSAAFIDDVRARFPALLTEARRAAAADGVMPPRSHVQMAPYYQRVGRRIILQHRAGLFWSSVSSVIGLYVDPLWQLSFYYLGYPMALAQMLFIPLALLVFACAVLGCVTLFRRHRPLALLLGLTLAYFTAVSSGPATDYRLSTPIAPEYAICLAAGLARLFERRPHAAGPEPECSERSATMRAS